MKFNPTDGKELLKLLESAVYLDVPHFKSNINYFIYRIMSSKDSY